MFRNTTNLISNKNKSQKPKKKLSIHEWQIPIIKFRGNSKKKHSVHIVNNIKSGAMFKEAFHKQSHLSGSNCWHDADQLILKVTTVVQCT